MWAGGVATRLFSVRVKVFMESVSPLEEVGVDILVLVVGVDVVLVVQSCPGEPTNIPVLSAGDVLHAPQRVCVKDDAPMNIFFMSATLHTAHLEMSPLKDVAPLNMSFILVTLDTSHLEMSPLNDFVP